MDVCACVATFICWAGDGSRPNTKGFPKQLLLSAVSGLFSVGVTCPPPSRPAGINRGGVSCCASLRRETGLPQTQRVSPRYLLLHPTAVAGQMTAFFVAVVDCWAGCSDPNTKVSPLPPIADGGHGIVGGPCGRIISRPIALGGFPSSAPKAACSGRCGLGGCVVRTKGDLGNCCSSGGSLFFLCRGWAGGGSAGGGGLCGICSFILAGVVLLVVGVELCHGAYN